MIFVPKSLFFAQKLHRKSDFPEKNFNVSKKNLILLKEYAVLEIFGGVLSENISKTA